MKLKFFKEGCTPEENHKLYRKLSKRYHSDMPGGSKELFQQLSEEYEYVKSQYEKHENAKPNHHEKPRRAHRTKAKGKRPFWKQSKLVEDALHEVLDEAYQFLSGFIRGK